MFSTDWTCPVTSMRMDGNDYVFVMQTPDARDLELELQLQVLDAAVEMRLCGPTTRYRRRLPLPFDADTRRITTCQRDHCTCVRVPRRGTPQSLATAC